MSPFHSSDMNVCFLSYCSFIWSMHLYFLSFCIDFPSVQRNFREKKQQIKYEIHGKCTNVLWISKDERHNKAILQKYIFLFSINYHNGGIYNQVFFMTQKGEWEIVQQHVNNFLSLFSLHLQLKTVENYEKGCTLYHSKWSVAEIFLAIYNFAKMKLGYPL